MKSNPLFVDSTKFHGDLINTQFELRRVLIYDNEKIFVIVSSPQGDFKRVAMKALEDGGFGARVHLNHQTLIGYRFEIEKDGKAFLFSRGFKARVQYAIVLDWEPTDEDSSAFEVLASGNSEPPALAKASASADRDEWPRAQVASIRSMMDKFGF